MVAGTENACADGAVLAAGESCNVGCGEGYTNIGNTAMACEAVSTTAHNTHVIAWFGSHGCDLIIASTKSTRSCWCQTLLCFYFQKYVVRPDELGARMQNIVETSECNIDRSAFGADDYQVRSSAMRTHTHTHFP